MGTYNKLQITLSIGAIFCSRLFLDLCICVDKLCKCIVDKLYTVDRLFLDLWIYMCILMRKIKAPKQVMIMNLWQVVIYESAICVFLDLWICNRLWFFFFFFGWICYNVYFWIFVVEQNQVMKILKCKSRLWFFLVCKMLYGCIKSAQKGPKQIPKNGPKMSKIKKVWIWAKTGS